MLPGATTLNGSRISPGKGETAALPRAGHSTRFSISGRRSGAVQGTVQLQCSLQIELYGAGVFPNLAE